MYMLNAMPSLQRKDMEPCPNLDLVVRPGSRLSVTQPLETKPGVGLIGRVSCPRNNSSYYLLRSGFVGSRPDFVSASRRLRRLMYPNTYFWLISLVCKDYLSKWHLHLAKFCLDMSGELKIPKIGGIGLGARGDGQRIFDPGG